jgi:hypothetical protein
MASYLSVNGQLLALPDAVFPGGKLVALPRSIASGIRHSLDLIEARDGIANMGSHSRAVPFAASEAQTARRQARFDFSVRLLIDQLPVLSSLVRPNSRGRALSERRNRRPRERSPERRESSPKSTCP